MRIGIICVNSPRRTTLPARPTPVPELSGLQSGSADDRAREQRIDSADLVGADRDVYIVHLGEVYRLSQTRNGKLILTK